VIKRQHKYRAKPTVVDGVRFASQKEARRYQELKVLERAKEIADLSLQPTFDLAAAGDWEIKVGEYRGDFRYWDKRACAWIVEDVKGFKTPLYRWKKKHVEAQYGITIKEI
jgi:hypothetical protein